MTYIFEDSLVASVIESVVMDIIHNVISLTGRDHMQVAGRDAVTVLTGRESMLW